MASSLQELIEAELPELVAIRHDLHRNPELSYQEHRTAALIAKELARLGCAVKTGVGSTGVLGYLPATEPSGRAEGAVALRADMDALPIEERTGKPYASCTPGVMHACGHDGHVTVLLGAARILARLPRPRPVLLVFQPAEEGGAGAERMCREGALAGEAKGGIGNPVAEIYGVHGWPTIPLGSVGSKPGPLLAATDEFTVRIKGVQCHGAYPHQGFDAILTAAHLITQLQSIASRNVGPLDSVVVTVGIIHAGTANNIIPEVVEFVGTVRTLRPETRALAKERLYSIIQNGAKSMGCESEILWEQGYPVTSNDSATTDKFFSIADAAFGSDRVIRVEHATMGGEDFSYYGHHVPACFYLLGLRPPNVQHVPTLHQPEFDFNDEALPMAIETMVRLALGR
jgi:amidohydrolase